MGKQAERKDNSAQPQGSAQLRAGKPREWYEKLMKEELKFERKGAPRPNIGRERLRPSAYAAMMEGNFPKFKKEDYSILHPDDLQSLVCAYLAFGKLGEAAVALRAYKGDFIALSREQRALLEKAISGNAHIVNDFFEKSGLEKLEPADRREILRLLISNKRMTYSFLVAHESEISADDFREVVGDLNIISITSKELDRLKQENRGSILEFLIDQGRMRITYPLFISYSHELSRQYFNKAIIDLLDRDEMWIDEALSQDPGKLDRSQVGKAILERVEKGKISIEEALEKYENDINRTGAGEEIVKLISNGKLGIDYAMQAFAGWLSEKQLETAILALHSKKKITTDGLLSKYGEFLGHEKIEMLILDEIEAGNVPTAAMLKHSKRIGLEKIKGAFKERYLQTKEKERKMSHDKFDEKWVLPTSSIGAVLGAIGFPILAAALWDWSGWGIVGGVVLGFFGGMGIGAGIGALTGAIVIPIRAIRRARSERKRLNRAWLGGLKESSGAGESAQENGGV